MFRVAVMGDTPLIDLEELLKLFFPYGAFELVRKLDDHADLTVFYEGDKNKLKREIFKEAVKRTGFIPPWGILTGIRPVKLTGELFRKLGDEQKVRKELTETYFVSSEKASEAIQIHEIQIQAAGAPKEGSVAVYAGIPFCPTRCAYCSFPSNPYDREGMKRYLQALYREMEAVSARMGQNGWYAESVYIGGGTPTSLEAPELEEFLGRIKAAFGSSQMREFTLEGGRPDTFTEEKLEAARKAGVDRLSINPQSMQQKTLDLIGRKHSTGDVPDAFVMARKCGFESINADLIAGLPGEDVTDFLDTLDQVMALGPDNITLHCLSVKRASRLKKEDQNVHFAQAKAATEMLSQGRKKLKAAGFHPYYLYRQKQMAGGNENTGYSLAGKEGLYNIRVMEENQTIVALGAGGISKLYQPLENRLTRVPNVADYRLYMKRLDEMILRKEHNLFGRI